MVVKRKTTITREARAGTEEQGDLVVCLSPGDSGSGIQVEIDSTVKSMFGDEIRASAVGIVEEYGLADLKIAIRDQGALDYAIRARVQTAIERALKERG